MRILKLVSLVLLLAGASAGWADTSTWDGGGSTDLWTDLGNWGDIEYLPGPGETASIFSTPVRPVLIDSNVGPITVGIVLGPGYVGTKLGTMNVTGGALNVVGVVSSPGSQIQVGYNGIGEINLSGGDINTPMLQVAGGPASGRGTFNMSGGTLKVTASTGVYLANGGQATFNFSGGTVSTPIFKVGNALATTVGTLNVTAGNFTPTVLVMGSQTDATGYFNVSGGSVLTGSAGSIQIGSSGHGIMNMTGGSVNSNGRWFLIGYLTGSTGAVHLDGGTITCGNFSMGAPGDTVCFGTGTMDITGGTLIINGNYTTKIEGYKTLGVLTGYGVAANVRVDYNTKNVGKTTVWAGTHVWDCSTPMAGDINGDCAVNFTDFAELAANWAACVRVPSSYCP